MRGEDTTQERLFSTIRLEEFVPQNHPIRAIRGLFDEALSRLNWLFNEMYCDSGRASIPPERLLRALLLQVLYTIRSERQLVEQMEYNLLFRWFVGLSIDDPVWSHSSFSKNRDRMLSHDVIPQLFEEVVELARQRQLLSEEHFSVDGTQIHAWASHKSFQPKDDDEGGGGVGRNQDQNFRGQKRKNDTHQSRTDAESMLYRKGLGKESKLSYLGHTVMENRHGLIVKAQATQATGTAEREAAVALLRALPGGRKKTVGADKGYDTRGFVEQCRQHNITPHVAQNIHRPGGSAIDQRTSRHAGYKVSQRKRKQIEEGFGWGKSIGLIRQVKVRGVKRVSAIFQMTFIGFNLVRMKNLQGSCA